MSSNKMHRDEVQVDLSLVHRLVDAQFPQWADLSIEPVSSAGTDNAIFRLGEEMTLRLPRIKAATAQVDKDHRWLPWLARHLPLAVPVPLARGAPAEDYPWQWSICHWLEGENASTEPIADLAETARVLARFVVALQGVEATDGPSPGEHNFHRGVPLILRDAATRAAIGALHGMVDTGAATAAWDAALKAPEHSGLPVWIHGDLSPGNLLVVEGRLSAVIDFGGLAVGDPACDLIMAWNLLSEDARDVFRTHLGVDDASWARGRGWALSIALIQLPYYRDTNPTLAANARHVIDEVLADH